MKLDNILNEAGVTQYTFGFDEPEAVTKDDWTPKQNVEEYIREIFNQPHKDIIKWIESNIIEPIYLELKTYKEDNLFITEEIEYDLDMDELFYLSTVRDRVYEWAEYNDIGKAEALEYIVENADSSAFKTYLTTSRGLDQTVIHTNFYDDIATYYGIDTTPTIHIDPLIQKYLHFINTKEDQYYINYIYKEIKTLKDEDDLNYYYYSTELESYSKPNEKTDFFYIEASILSYPADLVIDDKSLNYIEEFLDDSIEYFDKITVDMDTTKAVISGSERLFSKINISVSSASEDIQFYGNQAICYHRTKDMNIIESLITEGFKIGSGDYYGRGFYSTYDVASQLSEDNISAYGRFIMKYKASNISNCLIFNKDIRERVLGRKISLTQHMEEKGYFDFKTSPSQLSTDYNKKNFDKNDRKVLINKLYEESKNEGRYRSALSAKNIYDIFNSYGFSSYEKENPWYNLSSGIIYTGNRDGNCLVLWEPNKNIIPFGVAHVPSHRIALENINFVNIPKEKVQEYIANIKE